MGFDYVAYSYAACVAGGGLYGYFAAGSIPSLVAGLGCGALMGFGAYQTSHDPKDVKLSLFTCCLLTTIFAMRFMKTKTMMPTGYLACSSLLMAGRYAFTLYQKAPIEAGKSS